MNHDKSKKEYRKYSKGNSRDSYRSQNTSKKNSRHQPRYHSHQTDKDQHRGRSERNSRKAPTNGRESRREPRTSQEQREKNAIILDYLSQGRPNDRRPPYQRDPIAFAVGTTYFSLFEITLRRGVAVNIQTGLRLSTRELIRKLKRVKFQDLTNHAQTELNYTIEKLVNKKEAKFVDFFNNARPITTRMHQLRLLPGIGKTRMWKVLDARKTQKFDSFEDFKERTGISEPQKIIIKRILTELSENERYTLFTKPFPRDSNE
ncbi:MAG: DUF655 domain-containing protein [Candidatus Hodarchaeota archaeon]